MIKKKFDQICINVRKNILLSLFYAGSGHPGPSLSIVELLVYLYFEQFRFKKKKRIDKLILSKGHAAPALYAVLVEKKILKDYHLKDLRKINSPLQGHPDPNYLKEIDLGTGALGQGLSVGIGFSLANNFLKVKKDTYCILGDGELQEGQIWEAAMFIGAKRILDLCTIVDQNKFQNELKVKDTLNMGSIKSKFISFGFEVLEINGHNYNQLFKSFNYFKSKEKRSKPLCIILKTTKGKGVSFMENDGDWHSKKINKEEFLNGMRELNLKI